jgi:hypothetical protein
MPAKKKTDAVPKHTCTYVRVSDLAPKAWRGWFWEQISDNAPFSWGDNDRTLVTASRFAAHCEQRLLYSMGVRRFMKRLHALGETYIDLES